jgi:hypothetical protein
VSPLAHRTPATAGIPHISQARSNSGEYASAAVSTVRGERRAHDAARGHAVVATLGERALAGTDFPLLLDQTVSLVADTLRVAVAAVCELTADGALLLRAAHGAEHDKCRRDLACRGHVSLSRVGSRFRDSACASLRRARQRNRRGVARVGAAQSLRPEEVKAN